MEPEKFSNIFDYLNSLSIQQLRGILRSELDKDEMDVAQIKRINSVIAAKSQEDEIDVNAAFERLIDSSQHSDLLYDEVSDEIEEAENRHTRQAPKVRALLKIGVIAAVLAALFLGTGIAASAMGFHVWGAIAAWTDDRLGFFVPGHGQRALSDRSGPEDPYRELRDIFASLGDVPDVVPGYVPSGYQVLDVHYTDSVDGPNILCVLTDGEQSIVLNYIVLQEEPIRIFTKDAGDPELFLDGGTEHYIFSNDGHYRAVWLNGNMQCDFSGFTEKSELLKMIDSLYSGA